MGIMIFLATFAIVTGMVSAFVGIETIAILGIKWISGYIPLISLRACVGIAIHCFALCSFIVPIKVCNKLLDLILDIIGKQDKSNS